MAVEHESYVPYFALGDGWNYISDGWYFETERLEDSAPMIHGPYVSEEMCAEDISNFREASERLRGSR